MIDAQAVRRLALGPPGAVEHDHHGRPSFRVRGRIFATLWTPTKLNVMPGEEIILAAVGDSPGSCSKVLWGKRLRAVQVDLDAADSDLIEQLPHAAWSHPAA